MTLKRNWMVSLNKNIIKNYFKKMSKEFDKALKYVMKNPEGDSIKFIRKNKRY